MNHLLLLHGAIGSAQQFKELEERFSTHYQVHNLNLPGHGGTPLPASLNLNDFADYIADYCRNAEIDRVSIFGYSMGGYVALLLAKKHPELVERIATLATKFHWDEATVAKEIKMLQPDVIEQKVPQFAQTLEQRHAPADWKELLRKTGLMLEGLGKDNALKPEDYQNIQTPCLVMLGDRDRMVTLEETLAVHKALPHSELAILPGTPHPFENVSQELLFFLLKRFLGQMVPVH